MPVLKYKPLPVNMAYIHIIMLKYLEKTPHQPQLAFIEPSTSIGLGPKFLTCK